MGAGRTTNANNKVGLHISPDFAAAIIGAVDELPIRLLLFVFILSLPHRGNGAGTDPGQHLRDRA